MLRQLYIQFHTLLIIFAVVFPSLATAHDDNSNTTCGSDEPNSCPWDKTAWEKVWDLQRDICQRKISGGKPGAVTDILGADPWAQLEIRFEPGYDNRNCWKATSAIISGCFDTSRGKYQRSGSWCNNEECTEWYWMWMNPDYKPSC
jgi:hypothetical protein